MKQNEISQHWNRSKAALKAAEILLQNGLYLDSVSRSYYVMLHAARAALLVYDVVPKNHNHVRQSFGQYLVNSGEIEKQWAKMLYIAYRDRVNADYVEEEAVSEDSAMTQFNNAKQFVERMKMFLESKDIEI